MARPQRLDGVLVYLSEGEMKPLGASGIGIAHCPQSNARLADGIASTPQLDRLGVQVSLGVDGAAPKEAADRLCETFDAQIAA